MKISVQDVLRAAIKEGSDVLGKLRQASVDCKISSEEMYAAMEAVTLYIESFGEPGETHLGKLLALYHSELGPEDVYFDWNLRPITPTEVAAKRIRYHLYENLEEGDTLSNFFLTLYYKGHITRSQRKIYESVFGEVRC